MSADRVKKLVGDEPLDLREAIASNMDPSQARAFGGSAPASNLNIFIRNAAQAYNFPDRGILGELEFGLDNQSTTPTKVRIASAHKGAFSHHEVVTKSLRDEIGKGWIEGPPSPTRQFSRSAPSRSTSSNKSNGRALSTASPRTSRSQRRRTQPTGAST